MHPAVTSSMSDSVFSRVNLEQSWVACILHSQFVGVVVRKHYPCLYHAWAICGMHSDIIFWDYKLALPALALKLPACLKTVVCWRKKIWVLKFKRVSCVIQFLHAETTPDVNKTKRESTDKSDEVKSNVSFRAEKAGPTAQNSEY
jgi:hypothetical protein